MSYYEMGAGTLISSYGWYNLHTKQKNAKILLQNVALSQCTKTLPGTDVK